MAPASRLIKDEFETQVQVEGNLSSQDRDSDKQPFRGVLPTQDRSSTDAKGFMNVMAGPVGPGLASI